MQPKNIHLGQCLHQAKNTFVLSLVVEDDESSESEGEDGEDLDLEGIFDNVPLDNSDLAWAENLMLDDLEAENLSLSPLAETPPPPTPASPPAPAPTQIAVAADVHHSPNLDLDETPRVACELYFFFAWYKYRSRSSLFQLNIFAW